MTMNVFPHKRPPLQLSARRNVSILCFAQFASNVGCPQPTVRLRQLGVFNTISWVLQNEQHQIRYHRTYRWLVYRAMASSRKLQCVTTRRQIPHPNRHAEGTLQARSTRLIPLHSVLKIVMNGSAVVFITFVWLMRVILTNHHVAMEFVIRSWVYTAQSFIHHCHCWLLGRLLSYQVIYFDALDGT